MYTKSRLLLCRCTSIYILISTVYSRSMVIAFWHPLYTTVYLTPGFIFDCHYILPPSLICRVFTTPHAYRQGLFAVYSTICLPAGLVCRILSYMPIPRAYLPYINTYPYGQPLFDVYKYNFTFFRSDRSETPLLSVLWVVRLYYQVTVVFSPPIVGKITEILRVGGVLLYR